MLGVDVRSVRSDGSVLESGLAEGRYPSDEVSGSRHEFERRHLDDEGPPRFQNWAPRIQSSARSAADPPPRSTGSGDPSACLRQTRAEGSVAEGGEHVAARSRSTPRKRGEIIGGSLPRTAASGPDDAGPRIAAVRGEIRSDGQVALVAGDRHRPAIATLEATSKPLPRPPVVVADREATGTGLEDTVADDEKLVTIAQGASSVSSPVSPTIAATHHRASFAPHQEGPARCDGDSTPSGGPFVRSAGRGR